MDIKKINKKQERNKKSKKIINKGLYLLFTPLRILYIKNKKRKRIKFDKKVDNLTDAQAMQILGDNIIKHLIQSKAEFEEVVICDYSKDDSWAGKNIQEIIYTYTKSDDLLRGWQYHLPFQNRDRYEELTNILKEYLNTINGVKAEYYIDDKRGNGCYFAHYKKTLEITIEELI